MTTSKMVREFHDRFGAPNGDKPSCLSKERMRLRLKLIAEEFAELLHATGLYDEQEFVRARDGSLKFIDSEHLGDCDIVGTADALADMSYVIFGMALEMGIDLDAVLEEVHRSNLSKLGSDGKPVRREDGKIMKPPGWSPPDIARVLREQGWEG